MHPQQDRPVRAAAAAAGRKKMHKCGERDSLIEESVEKLVVAPSLTSTRSYSHTHTNISFYARLVRSLALSGSQNFARTRECSARYSDTDFLLS